MWKRNVLVSAWTKLVLHAVIIHIQFIQGQRLKEEGCWFGSPDNSFVCEDEPTSVNIDDEQVQLDQFAIEEIITIENICSKLIINDIFPNDDIYLDTTLHSTYINDNINSNDVYCTELQYAYKYCTFCATPKLRFESQLIYQRTKCGGNQPTIQQVIGESSNNNNNNQFHTVDDINVICEQLANTYNSKALYPRSIPLTKNQILIKHLCYNECQNGCFDPITYPTTCTALEDDEEDKEEDTSLSFLDNQNNDNNDNDLTNYLGVMCDYLNSFMYYWMDDSEIRNNVQEHANYLRAIPKDSPQCSLARQAYPLCPQFCSFNNSSNSARYLCFRHDYHPATCDSNRNNNNDNNHDGVDGDDDIQMLLQDPNKMKLMNDVCIQLSLLLMMDEDEKYNNLFQNNDNDDNDYRIYPIPMHTEKLVIANNTKFCNYAREYYHLCYWCAPTSTSTSSTSTSLSTSASFENDVDDSVLLTATNNSSNATDMSNQQQFPEHQPQQQPMDFCNRNDWCSYQDNNDDDVVKQYNYLVQEEDLSDCDKLYDEWTSNFYYRYNYPACFQDIHLHQICYDSFCNANKTSDIDYNTYLGATTTKQKKALVWVSRAAAFLSFGGACYIIYDILRNKKARATVYHQLLIGMAIFDIITAVAWCFATTPIDKKEVHWVYGAIGNATTCTIQAFFIQLGLTSMFYNVSLAIYYVLVIAYGYRETRLIHLRPFMHGIPIVVGLGLAFGGIPIYHWMEYGCHLLPPPDGELWQVLVFVVLPLGISIVSITGSMVLVYWKVRQQAKAAQRWSMSGRGRSSTMERDVFYQCVFYVMAFFITWPIMFAVYLAAVDVNGPLGLTMTVAFVAPLQGFNNFLVFIRPKFSIRKRSGAGGFLGSSWSGPQSTLYGMMRSIPFMPGRDGRSGLGSRWLGSSRFSTSVKENTNNEGREGDVSTGLNNHEQLEETQAVPQTENPTTTEYRYEMDPSAMIAQDDYEPDKLDEHKEEMEAARRDGVAEFSLPDHVAPPMDTLTEVTPRHDDNDSNSNDANNDNIRTEQRDDESF